MIKIIFIGPRRPSKIQLNTFLLVKQDRVRNALQWLQRNNHLYSTIEIREEFLNERPEGDIPESLWQTLHQETDVVADAAESSGYVVDSRSPLVETSTQNEPCTDPPIVLHLEPSGLIDIEVAAANNAERTANALDSLLNHNSPGSQCLLVPHGAAPESDYDNPNLFPGMFPTLYPYGLGGFDLKARPDRLSMAAHVKYLLRQADRRSATHPNFMLIAFNIIQRREVCRQAKITVKRPGFQTVANKLVSITTMQVKDEIARMAAKNYEEGKNDAVSLLMRNIKLIGGKAKGAFHARASMRNEIKSMIVAYGLPSVFITVNPSDIHHPIFLILAGADINIDIISSRFPPSPPSQ